jgi:hypothetical protein
VYKWQQGNTGRQLGELDHAERENDMELKGDVEESKLHRMATVHDFLEMCQGSQNLCGTQMESQAQSMQITPIGYILDTDEIIKASWLNL